MQKHKYYAKLSVVNSLLANNRFIIFFCNFTFHFESEFFCMKQYLCHNLATGDNYRKTNNVLLVFDI